MRNFWQALAAVLIGNAAYYLVLPYLPAKARHIPFHTDIGILVDLWFCMVAFGLIKIAMQPRRNHHEST